jgi:hypothetical protein
VGLKQSVFRNTSRRLVRAPSNEPTSCLSER